MGSGSSKYCDACGKNKVAMFCKECQEAFCRNCSEYHRRFSATKEHDLIAYLDHLKVTAGNVQYHAQVAVDGGQKANIAQKDIQSTSQSSAQVTVDRGSNVDKMPQEPHKTHEEKHVAKAKNKTPSDQEADIAVQGTVGYFSIKTSKDRERVKVGAILVLSDKIIVVDNGNRQLKLFDMNRQYLSSIDYVYEISGICRFDHNEFLTCGKGKQIFRGTLRGKYISCMDYEAEGVIRLIRCVVERRVTGTCYCLLPLKSQSYKVAIYKQLSSKFEKSQQFNIIS